MSLPASSYRFSAGRFLAFKAAPVWLVVAVLGVTTGPGLPDDHAVRELLEAAGIMVLMAMVVGRFWTILAMEAGRNGQIAVQGPFRYLAHPMEFFFALGMLGIGFMYESILLGVFMFLGCLAALKYWVDAGDAMLEKDQPAVSGHMRDFREQYRRLVPAFIPSIKPAIVPYYGDHLNYTQHTLLRSAWDIIVFTGCIPIIELVAFLRETGAVPGLLVLP
ncbi:methyltransferase [Salaquimonas pukyongi]|uniref:methyltransferase n=1 Tax=Salaquimonas pukyongi TaxID=2712698 RepID=UPI00096BA8F7|nr:methyltransferase [Salaquimonas pukyongi]